LSNRDALIKLPINQYEKIMWVCWVSKFGNEQKLLPDDLRKNKYRWRKFNSVDFIVSTSNFIGDPKYVARYKKPETSNFYIKLKKAIS
jgi:hypothetical protein